MKKIISRKGVLAKSLSVYAAFATVATGAAPAFAAGTAVLGGSAELSQLTRVTMDKNDPTEAVFSSTEASGVLDWTRFNVPNGTSMTFNGAGTTFFNLVDGAAGKSQIDGIINGNGSVWVINPAGVAFGASSRVDVGGLFAAAAGSLENAAALRDGTATSPEFSAFAGSVDVQGGTFSADRVALLGKSVSVDGSDMKNVGHLSIGAGNGMTVVDNVAQGKVSVNITEFSNDPSEKSVQLGDLDLGGGVDYGFVMAERGLEVRAGNGIEVSGTVSTDGNAFLYTKNGDISVTDKGAIHANGVFSEVDLISAMDVEGKGDVIVNGEVKADVDFGYGSIYAYAGYGNAGAGAKSGDVTVGGTLRAGNMVDVYSVVGDATVAKGGVVDSANGKAKITADGYASINGTVSSSLKSMVYTNRKGITVGKDGVVESSGDGSSVQIVSAINEGGDGNVQIDGAVRSASSGGSVWIEAGYGEGAKGNVQVDSEGEVSAADILEIGASSGAITIDGTVSSRQADFTASGDISVFNYDNDISGIVSAFGNSVILLNSKDLTLGDVTAEDSVEVYAMGKVAVEKDATIYASGDGADLSLASLFDNVVVDGNLVTDGQMAKIFLMSALYDGNGDININGKVDARGNESYVEVDAGSDITSGSILVGGSIVASGSVNLQSGFVGGGVTVAKEGVVRAVGEHAEVNIRSGYSNAGGDDIDIKGSVSAESDNAAIVIGTGGNVGGRGNVYVSGNVYAKGKESSIKVETGNMDSAAGNVAVSGKISTEGDGSTLLVRSGLGDNANGNIILERGGEFSVSGNGAKLGIGSGKGENAEVNLNLKGEIVANGDNTRVEIASGIGKGSAGNVDVSGSVTATGNDAVVVVLSSYGEGSNGSIDLSGAIGVSGDNANVEMVASNGKSAQGAVNISGSIQAKGKNSKARAYAGYGDGASGNINLSGTVGTVGDKAETLLLVGYGKGAHGSVNIGGTLSANGNGGNVSVVGGSGDNASGSVVLGGSIAAANDAQIRVSGGNVTVNGSMSAGNTASVVASSGSLAIGGNGIIGAGSTANVVVDGGISQIGNAIGVNGGVADVKNVPAGIAAGTINLKAGGSIGGKSEYLGVDGSVHALAGGDIYLAAANKSDFRGGDSSGAPSIISIAGFERAVFSIDENGIVKDDEVIVEGIDANFTGLGGTSAIVAGGNLSIYTAGKLQANGLLKAGGDITVSSSEFGDVSYLQAGGLLTINNVGKSPYPRIAYFESVNGVEPRINNLPNDMVVFVDGRLAGGNLDTLNKFGADEAFMVETPELKSTQGIFGNPPFLHSDLDVANPMAVSAVDYLIQEVPRLTLSSDFPADVDQNIEANGLGQKDVYWFGHKDSGDETKPGSKTDEKTADADKKPGSETDKSVAMFR